MEKKARIEYLLSEKGRKTSLLAGGNGKELQVVETDITPELLELARVNDDGDVFLDLAQTIAMDLKIQKYGDGRPEIKNIEGRTADNVWDGKYHFDAPQTSESLITWEKTRREHIAAKMSELKPEFDRLMAEYQAKEAEKAVERKQREEEAHQREEAAKAERARLKKEKADWITAHGSDYLKRATKLGYDCQRQYVTEKAELELPDFEVDFDDLAAWKSRVCPSMEALEEIESLIEKGFESEVVWLTKPAHETAVDCYHDDEEMWPDEDHFEPCEAIVVRNYIGEYDLVKIV